MTFQNKEQNCALCHAYLFPEDDVVYCPVCGAPHHRECYNSKGDCALEEFHGTENQYDLLKRAEEEKKAERDKAESTASEDSNNSDFNTPFGNFAPFDFLGGVKPDTVIEEGVTARDAAKCVFSNTMRYIPKFVRGNKASWNFIAFFFPGGWFLSRKMYKYGIIAAVIEIIGMLLTVPFQLVLNNLPIDKATTYLDLMQKLAEHVNEIPPLVVSVAFIGSMLTMALKILSAIFGDWLYRNHIVKTVRKINAESQDRDADFRKKGGVNLLLFLVGAFAVRYIPAIIAMFI